MAQTDYSKKANVNKGLSFTVLPPGNWVADGAAAWTELLDDVARHVIVRKDQGDAAAKLFITPQLESRSISDKGARLKSVDVQCKVGGADLDAVLVAKLFKVVPTANGAALAAAAEIATTASGGTDVAQGDKTVTLTVDNAVHLDNNEALLVELTVDGAAGTDFDWQLAVFKFEQKVGNA